MNYMTIPNELVRATTYPKPTYTDPNNIAYSKHIEHECAVQYGIDIVGE